MLSSNQQPLDLAPPGDARRAFLILLCLLAPLTDAKIADIQPVEVFLMLSLIVALAWVVRADGMLRTSPQLTALLKQYSVFILLTLALAFLALRLPTFPPPDVSPLKSAPLLSISRVIQLCTAIAAMVLVATIIARRHTMANLVTQVYVYAGLLSAVYGVAATLLFYAGIETPGAYAPERPRARAFFNEGGPFGVYLASVILVSVFRRKVLKRGTRATFAVETTILWFALFMSWSKAGILVLMVVAAYYMVLVRRMRYLVVAAILFTPLLLFSDFVGSITTYIVSSANIEQVLAERPDDGSIIRGRVMGMVLVPIMTLAHPLAGIGFGNYSLQRNNPELIGTLPTSDEWDLAGLGLLGYMPEFGVPLFLFLCWLLWRPAVYLRKISAPALAVILGSYQILAHLTGAQITFVYPWIVSGIALGYCAVLTQQQRHEPVARRND